VSSLTASGLQIDNYDTVLRSIEASERVNIDPNIYTQDDELLGQINQVIAERVASVNDLAQAVYDAFNLAKAEQKQLDDLAALRNVRRQGATYSTGIQTFISTEGVSVPAGTVISNNITGDRFQTTDSIVASTSSSFQTTYRVDTLLDSTEYTININSVNYSYTSGISATNLEIVTGLYTDINAGTDTTIVASIVDNTLVITAVSSVQPITSTTITYLKATSIKSKVGIQSQLVGDIVAPSNAITKLITPLLGITSTYNENALSVGRQEETDEELRVRIAQVTSTGSTGTIPSITSALISNVDGVSSVNIIENVLAVPDVDGRPAHSYETIVQGGLNEDVAIEIWRTKPAGIGLYGNTLELITDSVGNLRSIYFTRPSPVNLAVRVQYSKYTEEAFSSLTEDLIRATVLEQINALSVGKDVIPLRLVGPIYNATSAGLDEVIVEIQVLTASGDTPVALDWQSTKLSINNAEYANTTSVDIYVEEI